MAWINTKRPTSSGLLKPPPLRAKFEKLGEPEKLKILDDINAYVEDLEKHYSSE